MARRLPNSISVHLTGEHFNGSDYTHGIYKIYGKTSCALSKFLHDKYPDSEISVGPENLSVDGVEYIIPVMMRAELIDHHPSPTGYMMESKVGKPLKFKLVREA